MLIKQGRYPILCLAQFTEPLPDKKSPPNSTQKNVAFYIMNIHGSPWNTMHGYAWISIFIWELSNFY